MKYEDDPLTIRDQIKQAFEVEVEDGEDITNSVLAIHYVRIHFSWKIALHIISAHRLFLPHFQDNVTVEIDVRNLPSATSSWWLALF